MSRRECERSFRGDNMSSGTEGREKKRAHVKKFSVERNSKYKGPEVRVGLMQGQCG